MGITKRSLLLFTIALLGCSAITAGEIRNAWTDFPVGAWIELDWSERWGTNPPTIDVHREVLTGHRPIGTSLTDLRRTESGVWKRFTGGLHGAYPPDGEGMALESESPEGLSWTDGSAGCLRRTYVHDEADGSGQRLTLWHCKGIELAPRVLPQWSVSFGWQLAPDVVRARIERRDTMGAVTSVDLELEAASDPLPIDGRDVPCFRETLLWRHRMPGQAEGQVTGETKRWICASVPGRVGRQVDDNRMGRITERRVRRFGLPTQD